MLRYLESNSYSYFIGNLRLIGKVETLIIKHSEKINNNSEELLGAANTLYKLTKLKSELYGSIKDATKEDIKRAYDELWEEFGREEKKLIKDRIRRKSIELYPDIQTCSIKDCSKKGQRHHPDYNDPANIVWLCEKHHKVEHKRLRDENKTV